MSKQKIVIFVGAGLSADSGLATFRQGSGKALWENHDPEQIANIDTWKKNKDLVHRFYNARREQLADVQPNAAHHVNMTPP